ncbi:MAG TPA: nuclease-related domain-containing protein, partial [Anaerolineae bacterium]|nr:nuclease-related domain-containing protein [Anaerolineae bacterium]
MTVELWIGQPFDTQHEQVALARFMYDMEQRLGRKREIYFVLANCLVGGNQIDLVILKQNAIIVVELKECHEPFRATENGKWLTPSGRVVGTGSENPLEQVGRYRRRWINFLRHRGSRFLSPASLRDLTVEHVTSFVCISPKLHPSVNQDIPPLPWFRLTGLDQIVGLLEQHSSDFKFTEADLRRLIKDLNLRKLDSLESVVSPEA